MTKNFLNLVEDMILYIQEVQQAPSRIKAKNFTLRHFIIKLSKDKDKLRMLKAASDTWLITCKGFLVRLAVNFSSEPMEVLRQWDDIFKVSKEPNCQAIILYLAKLFSKIKKKLRQPRDKWKLRVFTTCGFSLQDILKEIFQAEMKWDYAVVTRSYTKK